jgi:glycosyltransferase involved in cell wall biosynthesis
MRELAKAQAASGLYKAVGVGVIVDTRWPAIYHDELRQAAPYDYLARTPGMFGTLQDLWQRIQKPPIDSWVEDLLARSGAGRCVVHFHNAWLSGVFLPLKTVKQGRAQVVTTFHGVNGHFRGQPVRQRIHQWMAARLIKHGAKLTSVDRANLERAERLLGLEPKYFTVVPNGMTDTTLRACPKLGGAEHFTAGHVGSISSAKGWQILVEAAKQLRTAGHKINLVLAGRGPEAELAQKLANESGGWIAYDGFVPGPRETVMPKLDALVLMSEQEGLPMAIIEAFSTGLPVVATAVGGVPEAVSDGSNGFLVDRNAVSLAAALERLLKVPGKLRALSQQARQAFEERYEISRIVAQYDVLYSKDGRV